MMTLIYLIHVVVICYLNIVPEICAAADDSVCDRGQYGRWCRYNCSSFCNFDKCTISHERGVPGCNEGCKKYHTGFFCQEFCPSLCLECNQTDSSCHTCVDGHYGLTCNQTCHRNCLNGTCNIIDGSCILAPYEGGKKTRFERANSEVSEWCQNFTEDRKRCLCCATGLRGDGCEQDCPNCQTFYIPNSMCEYQCKAGYYGNTCDVECPERCQPGNSGKPLCEITSEGLRCMNGCNRGYTGLQCNDTCSENCKDTCYQTDGKCVDCPNGKYGDMCNMKCSEGCKNNTCSNEDGSCQGGCKIGFFRDNCTGICGDKCVNSTCEEHFDVASHFTTFLCSEGCKNGYRGRSCGEACPKHCMICEQLSDSCIQCFYGFHLENRTGPALCFKNISELVTIQISTSNPVVILAVALALALAAIIILLAFKIKKLTTQSSGIENPTHSEEEGVPLRPGNQA